MVQAKQIEKVLQAFVRVSAFAATGGNDTVTTPITTALSTAGNGGVSVPLQVSSGIAVIGVVTASNHNRVQIFNSDTKLAIADEGGNEIYGRLTESGGVYTLTYYVNDAGTETGYTFGSSTDIDYEFIYRFDFDRLPDSVATSSKNRNVSDDPAGIGGNEWINEAITVTSTNTLADITYTPATNTKIFLMVNGVTVNAFGGGSAAFSVSATTITWSATNAGYALTTTDNVVAFYEKA